MKNHLLIKLGSVVALCAILTVTGCEKEKTVEVVRFEEPVTAVINLSIVDNYNKVVITWEYPNNLADSFRVERSEGTSSKVLLSKLNGNIRTYTDSNFTIGTDYTYFVTVVKGSRLSSTASVGLNSTTNTILTNHSVTPALVTNVMAGIDVYSLISTEDTLLAESPSFKFGGSADGIGFLKVGDQYVMLTNHEDTYAISRVTFDKTLKPIKGDYLVDSDIGNWRQCSGSLATFDEHGFFAYLSGSEGFGSAGVNGSRDSRILKVDPFGAINNAVQLPALGIWSTENALPLPKTAYPGKTAIFITDDQSDSYGGQVALYISNTVGDLNSGKLYVMARTSGDTTETSMLKGSQYDVIFKELVNPSALTTAQHDAAVEALGAIKFGRVEDSDYRKDGVGREIYFAVTGQDFNGANANKSRTKYGRTYKLVLDATDPLKGKLEVILDGDGTTTAQGGANESRTTGANELAFMNQDNICVTQNYVYIQEDPNGYGANHDAYIYQYDIATKQLKVVMELDHHRDGRPFVRRNGTTPIGGTISGGARGTWEYGGLIDISSQIGIDNTFLLCVQPHGWTGYPNPDGKTNPRNDSQGSQVILIKGLPR